MLATLGAAASQTVLLAPTLHLVATDRSKSQSAAAIEEIDFLMSDVGVVVGRCAGRWMQEGYIGVYRRLHYRDYGPLLASNPH